MRRALHAAACVGGSPYQEYHAVSYGVLTAREEGRMPPFRYCIRPRLERHHFIAGIEHTAPQLSGAR